MELVYKKATLDDLDALVKMRIKVLRTANGLSDLVDMSQVESESRYYYQRGLQEGGHVAYLVYDRDAVIGAGGVSFYQVMPTYCNPSGKKAYLMNLYTEPDYRRKGIAWQTLDLLVHEARERGVDFITLDTTKMGRPLYEKYGFISMQDEMILPRQ
ncbi:MAG: GNAT family N-acetyltransferase [Bacillota bacterium]